MKACRLCLATGVKFTHLGNPRLKDFIQSILKSKGYPKDLQEENYVCVECRALLVKSYMFIQRVLRAQMALYMMKPVTSASLKKLDRRNLNLLPTLSYHRVEIDYYIEENESQLEEFAQSSENDILLQTGNIPHIYSDENEYNAEDLPKKEIIEEFAADPITTATTTYITVVASDQLNGANTENCYTETEIQPDHLNTSIKMKSSKPTLKRLNGTVISADNIVTGTRKKKPEVVISDPERDHDNVTKKKQDKGDDYEPQKSSDESELSLEYTENESDPDYLNTSKKTNISKPKYKYERPLGTVISTDNIVTCARKKKAEVVISDPESDHDNVTKKKQDKDDDYEPQISSDESKSSMSSLEHSENESDPDHLNTSNKTNISKPKYKYERPLGTVINTDNIVIGARKKKTKFVISNPKRYYDNDNDNVMKKKHDKDGDYEPSESSEESVSSLGYDVYEEDGKRRKGRKRTRPVDNRVYPMQCDHCDYEIEQKSLHYKHYLYYHPKVEYPYGQKKKYICQFCGVAKPTTYHLRDHELLHSNKKTIKCKRCPKMFHNRARMHRHNRYFHSQILICDYCNKTFHVKCDLRLHIRTHTGEKPFKCHICGEAFAHRGNVGIHIRNVHQNEQKRNTKRRKKQVKHKDDTDESEVDSDACLSSIKKCRKGKSKDVSVSKNAIKRQRRRKNNVTEETHDET